MHIADWRATYMLGVVGANVSALSDDGAYGDESRNHWPGITGNAPSTAARSQLIHSVHSSHYPGNCSIEVWGGRNCAAVITRGDLKLIQGYAGDPRVLAWNESTHGASVPFGSTGGTCGIYGHADRCQSPGQKGGKPKPLPNDPGGCLHGCLFNLTADPSESINLYTRAEYAQIIGALEDTLADAGATAPPWFQAPEVQNYTQTQLTNALCNAAKRSGGCQPINY
eukprot:UC1_evm1s40